MTKIAGSGSASGSESGSGTITQSHRSVDQDPDPDPHQVSWIRITAPNICQFFPISVKSILVRIVRNSAKIYKKIHEFRPHREKIRETGFMKLCSRSSTEIIQTMHVLQVGD
jgi:hypothetical protein